jgi:hypothetical protein
MERCQYELATEKYFGLPENVNEKEKVNVDYGILVDFACSIKNGFMTGKSMPDYDGQYLVAIQQKQECGNIWEYQKVIECFMNRWVVEDETENIIGWMPLPEFPSVNDGSNAV